MKKKNIFCERSEQLKEFLVIFFSDQNLYFSSVVPMPMGTQKNINWVGVKYCSLRSQVEIRGLRKTRRKKLQFLISWAVSG